MKVFAVSRRYYESSDTSITLYATLDAAIARCAEMEEEEDSDDYSVQVHEMEVH